MVIIPFFTTAQSWSEIKTVKEVCNAYPELMKTMLGEFNLDYKGLEKVKLERDSGNLIGACNQLLEYYKNGSSAQYLRKIQPVKTAKTKALADTILKNVFVVQNVRGEVLIGDDGHRDWYYKGPNHDREWAWLSNRHSQISIVLSTFFETGNPKYATYIDLFLRDFIIKSMPYPGIKSNTSVWRGLEVAARAKVWSRIFYGLINSEYLSESTKLLMLSSLLDHAHYSRNFHGDNNWLTMEISSLATLATNFPEYKESNEWLQYAANTISESMKGQVYPDGVQTELTSHYHNVAMRNFVLFKEICDRANYPLPDYFNQTIEKMYGYLAHTVRPDGNRILNNDGDLGSDIELILKGSRVYNKLDWAYIATNGTSGVKPKEGPSYFYPWAGQLISRGGYDRDAHWSYFDIGPWGSGHQHNDNMHISISAYNEDFLVDAGRFAYTGEVAKKFRSYAKGTQGHNTILIDGKGQQSGVRVVDKPISENHYKITPDFDFAWNSFDQYHDIKNVEHSRSLFYVRGNFWVIVDHIKTDKPREIETLWHFHPDCIIEIEKEGTTATKNEKGNLIVIPVGKSNWVIDVIEGQEEPEIQGWYSKEYNKFKPNKAIIYSTKIKKDETFVWLLFPSKNQAPELKVTIVKKDKDGIDLKVAIPKKGSWNLTIPYVNSAKAKFKFQ